jgi:hypothetical protein
MFVSQNAPATKQHPSPFGPFPELTPENIAASTREEIHRSHRRKQLNFSPGHDVHAQSGIL